MLRTASPDEFPEAIDESVACVLLTHVSYRTGRMYDMRRITEAAHAKRALMIWDLATLPARCRSISSGADVDFAVGCGYKFLTADRALRHFFISQSAIRTRAPALSGWFGHAAPFAFEECVSAG